MCGIAGFFNRAPDKTLLRSMISQLSHRGPDGYGYYINNEDKVGLAHARLSIIDLDGGFQPIHNEDKTIWVVLNGEIFNYLELRNELITLGHRFSTQSDTEVIVHAYEEWYLEFPLHLNGQYAISIWDEGRHQGLLVRDRVGIQPLFYSVNAGSLYFGSEVKALFANPVLRNGLDRDQLSNTLTFWSTSVGNTVFNGIYEVPPGHYVLFTHNTPTLKCYWDHTYNADFPAYQALDTLETFMNNSVHLRLRSDVPVGAYLSGGLDSTLIASLVKRYTTQELKTFSIRFEDAKYDESKYQYDAVKHLGVSHTSFVCKAQDIVDNFQNVIYHTEKPILRTAPVPMYLLSKLVREYGIKVVLTGEGADEVFAGYDIFRENMVRRAIINAPDDPRTKEQLLRLYPWMTDQLSSSLNDLHTFFTRFKDLQCPWFSHETRWRTTSKTNRFFSDSMPVANCNKFANEFDRLIEIEDPLNRAQYLEFHTLFSGYLIASQGDRMLMAHGVEGRFPFLDPKVVDFGNSLPPDLHLTSDLEEKFILKEFARKKSLVPESIFTRSKQPYMAPDGVCFFFQNTPEYVMELLSSDKLESYGYFDKKKVQILVKKFNERKSRSFPENMAFLGVLSTQILHHLFVENFQVKSIAPEELFIVRVEK